MGKVIPFSAQVRRSAVAWPRWKYHRGVRGRTRRRNFLTRYYGFLLLAALAIPAWFYTLTTDESTATVHRHFSICRNSPRTNCVIDGDTFYFRGEKIRIADINTPEIFSPQCAREAQLGRQATRRLHTLLNAGAVELRRGWRDRDVYGRKLRTVYRNGHSLGDTLVAEGLAHYWHGFKEDWCG